MSYNTFIGDYGGEQVDIIATPILLPVASLGWSETLTATLDAHCTACPPT